MKAKRIDGQTPGGIRTHLAQVIPLTTPYIVQIFPAYTCNFKCNYCIHSVSKQQRGYISNAAFMDFNLYKKCIDDLRAFPEKIKMLRFAGTGEPLLHKDIARMIDYANKKQIASSIDMVTNGSMLTPKLSKEIVDAGLSKLRISLQGVNAEKYKQTSNVEVDFNKLLENITYFYENKKNTQIYIKIIDCALDEQDEQEFLRIFGDICDEIAIEHVVPIVSEIDYTLIYKDAVNKVSQNGATIHECEICPQPFYLLQINPDGNIVPCCAMEDNPIIENCKNSSLFSIWNGEGFNRFRKNHLLKQKDIYATCKNCQHYKYGMFSEDMLDNDAERLLKYF